MKQHINSILLAEGELFGFPATFGIGRMQGELTVVGSLKTRGKRLSDLMNSEEVDASACPVICQSFRPIQPTSQQTLSTCPVAPRCRSPFPV